MSKKGWIAIALFLGVSILCGFIFQTPIYASYLDLLDYDYEQTELESESVDDYISLIEENADAYKETGKVLDEEDLDSAIVIVAEYQLTKDQEKRVKAALIRLHPDYLKFYNSMNGGNNS